jgi:hypothetical protein
MADKRQKGLRQIINEAIAYNQAEFDRNYRASGPINNIGDLLREVEIINKQYNMPAYRPFDFHAEMRRVTPQEYETMILNKPKPEDRG